MDDYQASMADPNRLVLNAEIAVVDARIGELEQLVDTRESGRVWSELQKQARSLEVAQKARNAEAAATAQFMILSLIAEGHAESTAWNDIFELIDRRRKLVESERKRLVQAQQLVHVEQAMALLGLMVDAVRRHVDDDAVLGAIVDEYARLTGVPVPVAPPPALPARGTGRGSGG